MNSTHKKEPEVLRTSYTRDGVPRGPGRNGRLQVVAQPDSIATLGRERGDELTGSEPTDTGVAQAFVVVVVECVELIRQILGVGKDREVLVARTERQVEEVDRLLDFLLTTERAPRRIGAADTGKAVGRCAVVGCESRFTLAGHTDCGERGPATPTERPFAVQLRVEGPIGRILAFVAVSHAG